MKKEPNHITQQIIGAAISDHKELGPGLLESAYGACLARELVEQGLKFELQKGLPIFYHGVRLDCGYRIDMLVEGEIILELKAGEKLEAIHEAQLLSYLKLSGCKIGLLINFNVKYLKDGVRRFVNKFAE